MAAGSNYDADSDGISNLQEYALGGNPTVSDRAAIEPTLGLSSDQSNFYYTHKERTDDKGLLYTMETSSDQVSNAWSVNSISVSQTENPSISDFKTVTTEMNMDKKGSIHLKVEQRAAPAQSKEEKTKPPKN